MKPIAAFIFVIAMFAGCDRTPTTATTESALDPIRAGCYKPAADPAAVLPWEATYPIHNQHIYCQEMIAETNPWQWPAGFTPCSGGPGLHQLDVYVADASGTGPGLFCTRVNVPFGAVTLRANYVETLELGWLASRALPPSFIASARYVYGLALGRGTAFTFSSLQDVNATGCVPQSACVQGWVLQTQSPTWFPIKTALDTYSWAMGTNGLNTCMADPGYTLDAPVACPGFTHCMACTESRPGSSGTVASCVSAAVNTICAAHCSECYEP